MTTSVQSAHGSGAKNSARPVSYNEAFGRLDRARVAMVTPPPAQQWTYEQLQELYALCERGEEQSALERAVATLELMFRTGRFDEANSYIARADVDALAPRVVLGMLTISFHAKKQLKKRPDFLTRAETRLRTALGPERANRLLATRR